MRNFFFLAMASLFLAGDNFVSASLEEASLMENEAAASPEFNLVDRDVQSRRKDWDIFSTLLMSKSSSLGMQELVFYRFLDSFCSFLLFFFYLLDSILQCWGIQVLVSKITSMDPLNVTNTSNV